MTRVVEGIYDDVELGSGFFISDRQADVIADWLESYAQALEKAWLRNGGTGDPSKQKHEVVRSYIRAVKKLRERA